jgi:hypothetical protein
MPQQNSSADSPSSAGDLPPEDLVRLAALDAELPELNRAHSAEEVARARANIAEWSEYLPEDCVRLMIALGWHLSVLRGGTDRGGGDRF